MTLIETDPYQSVLICGRQLYKLDLYSQPRGNFYVHVFVRIVLDLDAVSTAA
jgi:hypothetical protein